MHSPRRRWFPGYTVAGVSTIAFIATAPGQTFVVSQINEPLRDAFGFGEFTLNTAYTVATIAAALPLVWVGRLTDRLGPRRMMALVALAFGLGCLAMAGAQGYVTVLLGFFLLRLLGQGSLSLVSQHAVAMWFHRRLGSINGLKMVVAFGAWAVVPQIAVRMIESLGWRWTYAAFGAAIWLAIIPLALLLVRDRPEDVGRRMDDDPEAPADAEDQGPQADAAGDSPHDSTSLDSSDRGEAEPEPPRAPAAPAPAPPKRLVEASFTLGQALRTRAYWTLTSAFILAPLVGTAFLFDMQPILALRGMDKVDAAAAVSAWSVAMAAMALPAGWLTDRVRPSALIPLGSAAIALSALALWNASTPLLASAAMVIYGVGQGLVAACASAATARFFGRAHHGAIRSFMVRLGVIGTGVGPLITGLSASLTGGYGAAMLVFLAMCLPVIGLGLALRPPAPPSS